MVEVDFSGNFLSSENCKAGDIGTFIDEGKLVDRSKNGKTWKQLNITVEVNQKQYTHSFRSSEGKRFQETFGKDTKLWVGKQFKVTLVPYVDGKEIKQNVEIVPLQEKVE
jgi:hypothetical protein